MQSKLIIINDPSINNLGEWVFAEHLYLKKEFSSWKEYSQSRLILVATKYSFYLQKCVRAKE